MNMNKGLFVVVEGRDGVGKTVMVEVIMEYLSNKLELNVMGTKEPGSRYVPGNELIRAMIFRKGESFDNVSQGLLFFIDHYKHAIWVTERIKNGVSVVSDRWLYSQYAYQAVKEEKQVDANKLYETYEGLQIIPDLVFILDCSREVTRERLQGRMDKDLLQKDKLWGDHEKNDEILREEYRKLFSVFKPGKNFFWINQEPKESPQEIFLEQIKPEIDRLVAYLKERKTKDEVIRFLKMRKIDISEKESNWIPMPTEVELRNGNVLCDMAAGPCACKAYHNVEETIVRIEKLGG